MTDRLKTVYVCVCVCGGGGITTNDQTKMIERCKHVSLVYQIKQNICLFIFITFYNISILNKGENATPELLPFIYKMMQPVKLMKVYLNVQRLGYAKLLMFYGCCHEGRHEKHLNETGVQFFRLQI